MDKILSIALVASVLWFGVSIDSTPDGGFQLSAPQAEAKNNGGNGGGSGGGKGNSDNGGQGKGKSAEKQGERISRMASKADKHNVRSELKDLNSLNRNIKGLINSRSPHIAAFRDLFYEGDKLKKPADIENLASLLGLPADTPAEKVTAILREVLDDLSESAVAEVETMLNQRLNEFKSLPVDENGDVVRNADDENTRG